MTTAMPAVKGPSLEEVLRGVPPEKLDQPCQDEHLCEVARHVTDWPSLAPLLEIDNPNRDAADRPSTTPTVLSRLGYLRGGCNSLISKVKQTPIDHITRHTSIQ